MNMPGVELKVTAHSLRLQEVKFQHHGTKAQEAGIAFPISAPIYTSDTHVVGSLGLLVGDQMR